MKAEFAPSLMCMDFLSIREQISILNKRMDMYHCDVMDGHFCKNITLSPDIIRTFASLTELPLDVHLMTTNPTDWIETIAQGGATYISPHAETINTDAFRVMNLIESLGCKRGVVLNPATPISYIKHYLNRIDMLTIMTVDVGFAGQPFIKEMLDKIREAKELRKKFGYSYKIQIDGSCNVKTFKSLRDAGADVFVVGSSGLFKNDPDLDQACDIMFENFQRETGETR